MLARESSFYGAMDGASKFVKGDAIAGIVIMLIQHTNKMTCGMRRRNAPVDANSRRADQGFNP